MNLIEIFEAKPFQDVGTFNAIFKATPILGVASDSPVEIKEVVPGGNRRVLVNGETLFIDLTQPKTVRHLQEKKAQPVKTSVKNLTKKQGAKLPSIYRKLTAGEFMTYSAVKELGEVHGISELSRNISQTSRTIYNNLPKLKELGLIKTERVISESGDYLKISIDTSNNK